MQKKCLISGENFDICEEDIKFYQKMGVPEPKLSPAERRRQRLAWTTFRTLHQRKCDATGKSILSMYLPNAKHPVYHTDFWWSDKWNALDYGQDFDFTKTFFEQFDQLLAKVPVMHQSVIHSENCEYINMAGYCKDCYLSFFIDYCENCYYIQDGNRNRYCMDCLSVSDSELCYECINCINCYETYFSNRCLNCHDCYFTSDCRGCNNCIGCFNLVNKSYYIFNKPCSKEEFERLRASLSNPEAIEKIRKKVAGQYLKFPKRFYFGLNNEGFSGDHISNCKNSYGCFNCHELENVKYADYFFEAHNCMDVSLYGLKSDYIYNCLKTGDSCSNNICCVCCWSGSSDNAYCHLVINTKNCFGCCSLQGKRNCILNKAYSQHEYEELRKKIIGHMKETTEWGEFFPLSMSPFPYNESIAQDYYPLTKTEALKRGSSWNDKSAGVKTNVSIGQRSIDQVDASVLNEVFYCRNSGKAFKIVKAELDLYKKMKIPLPDLCPEERHLQRLSNLNPKQLWQRNCAKCSQEIQTNYSPDGQEKVLCEVCYREAIT